MDVGNHSLNVNIGNADLSARARTPKGNTASPSTKENRVKQLGVGVLKSKFEQLPNETNTPPTLKGQTSPRGPRVQKLIEGHEKAVGKELSGQRSPSRSVTPRHESSVLTMLQEMAHADDVEQKLGKPLADVFRASGKSDAQVAKEVIHVLRLMRDVDCVAAEVLSDGHRRFVFGQGTPHRFDVIVPGQGDKCYLVFNKVLVPEFAGGTYKTVYNALEVKNPTAKTPVKIRVLGEMAPVGEGEERNEGLERNIANEREVLFLLRELKEKGKQVPRAPDVYVFWTTETGERAMLQKRIPGKELVESVIDLHQVDGAERPSEEVVASRLNAVAAQLCEGVGRLHRLGIAHCDLKTANFRLNGDFLDAAGKPPPIATMLDFGAASWIDNGVCKMLTTCTIAQMPPELLTPDELAQYNQDRESIQKRYREEYESDYWKDGNRLIPQKEAEVRHLDHEIQGLDQEIGRLKVLINAFPKHAKGALKNEKKLIGQQLETLKRSRDKRVAERNTKEKQMNEFKEYTQSWLDEERRELKETEIYYMSLMRDRYLEKKGEIDTNPSLTTRQKAEALLDCHKKIDAYALGLMVKELYSAGHEVPSEVEEVINGLLNPDPEKRMAADEARLLLQRYLPEGYDKGGRSPRPF